MPMMTESNVVKLPERQAEDAGKAVVDFVREHPAIAIAGGVAIGIAAAALLSRGSGRKLAKHALTLAEVASTAGIAFGRQAAERAEDAGGELRRKGGALAEKAGKLAAPAEEAVDHASEAAHRLLRKAVDLAGELAGKLRG
jgi:ElaB/YqjD/DUF883 family membrane-anchored ribosome-binding protein